ncbi:acyl carrier protein [Streptomyces abikoensis]|uniref:acyl carrier protein n=1 Tax=Streptomyces abikoensis TaxID=97398 RepID=UPI0019C43AD2|nr:acyl carrier protein [Streptomyces abikoensis]GGP51269.1 actinorhodin polyketide synthase acyl carrier protein [Streptomyces abikoensis]
MLSLEQLVQALRKSAGDSDVADLDGDILDLTYDDLGYDSLALLELFATLKRDHGIELSDDDIFELKTPRATLAAANGKAAA